MGWSSLIRNGIEMNKMKIKVLRPSIDGRSCYIRIPVARKIMGTGPHDSEILINAGISESLMDIAYNLETGVYSLDSVLSQKKRVLRCLLHNQTSPTSSGFF